METTLPKLVEMLVATKQAEGKTAKTVKWYREMLGRLVAYAGPETTIKELSVDLAREFVASLQNQEGRWLNNHYIPAFQRFYRRTHAYLVLVQITDKVKLCKDLIGRTVIAVRNT